LGSSKERLTLEDLLHIGPRAGFNEAKGEDPSGGHRELHRSGRPSVAHRSILHFVGTEQSDQVKSVKTEKKI
jgi:hypothetical protein